MAPAETELLDRLGSQGLSSTILVVPHHGSRTSSTRPFIEAVQPKEALISAGWRNRFGFPHADVIRRLESLGIRTWCTAGDGAICIVTNGMDYHIAGWRNRGLNVRYQNPNVK
jgi:competence protein ComEC